MTAVGRWADPRQLDRLPAHLQLLPAYGFLRPRGKATASAGCGEGPQQSSGSWAASHLSGIHGVAATWGVGAVFALGPPSLEEEGLRPGVVRHRCAGDGPMSGTPRR